MNLNKALLDLDNSLLTNPLFYGQISLNLLRSWEI